MPHTRPAPAGPRLLYIGGTGRSGSTLVSRVLSTEPGVVSVGEVGNLPLFWKDPEWGRCGCGRALHGCPAWRSALDELGLGDERTCDHWMSEVGAAMRPQRRRPRRGVALRSAHTGWPAAEFAGLYRALVTVSPGSILVDETKSPVYFAQTRATLRAQGWGVQLLHLLRAMPAVVSSWSRPKPSHELQEGGGHVHLYTRASPAVRAEWMAYNAYFNAACLALGGGSTSLVFEDFQENPTILARAAAFLGLPTDTMAPQLRTRRVTLGADHIVGGNPDKLRSGPTPIRGPALPSPARGAGLEGLLAAPSTGLARALQRRAATGRA